MAKLMRMTKGSIPKQLITYAIPLILGNIFQLTYNVVDSVIVGRFIGKEALAAVGTANPIMNIFIFGISGICIGASVIMGRFYGAKKEDMLKKEMATIAVLGVYFSLLVVIIGMVTAGGLLHLLKVPKDILPMSATYLRLIFLGMPFTYFYNAVSSALKSVGDSKTPLKFLVFAAVLNGVLDIIFIGFLGFGIICSALTTVIAQAISAILCIIYVYGKVPILKLYPSEFKIDRELLKETLKYGSVTALQQACQPIGKLMIQGAVNTMGIDVIAAFNAVSKIDDYAFTPEQNISHAMTTFIAQNNGAGKTERIKKGFHTGMFIELVYGIGICLVVLWLRTPIMELFVGKSSGTVVAEGSRYLSLMALFYIFPGFTNGMQGYFRGIGRMHITLVGTIVQTSLRVIVTFLLSGTLGIQGIAYACAIGWSVMLIVEGIYYRYMVKKDRIPLVNHE